MEGFVIILLLILGVIGDILLSAAVRFVPVYLFWNWVMPSVFALPEITYSQAFCLAALSACFFSHKSSSSQKD